MLSSGKLLSLEYAFGGGNNKMKIDFFCYYMMFNYIRFGDGKKMREDVSDEWFK